jgi:hypothetical protein
MHEHLQGADLDPAFITPADEDARDQSQVLREVLLIHPEATTLDELARELTVASTGFTDHDRIQRAVRGLVAGGLLHLRAGDVVLPTRAAVHFHSLYEV